MILIPLPDNFWNKINCLVHFQSYLSLDSHLTMLIWSPSIQLPIVHQRNRIRLTTLYFLYFHLLFLKNIVEKLISHWNIVVFIFTVAKGRVLSISPVENLIFIVKNNTKVSSCCYPLYFLTLECLHLCWFSDGWRNINSMTGRPTGVDKDFHEKIDIFSAKAPGIDFSLLWKCDSVPLTSNHIFDLYVILCKILYNFRFLLIFGITVTKFSISTWSKRVKISAYEMKYPDYPMATPWSTPIEALYIFSGNFNSYGLCLAYHTNNFPALKVCDRILILFRIIINKLFNISYFF